MTPEPLFGFVLQPRSDPPRVSGGFFPLGRMGTWIQVIEAVSGRAGRRGRCRWWADLRGGTTSSGRRWAGSLTFWASGTGGNGPANGSAGPRSTPGIGRADQRGIRGAAQAAAGRTELKRANAILKTQPRFLRRREPRPAQSVVVEFVNAHPAHAGALMVSSGVSSRCAPNRPSTASRSPVDVLRPPRA